MEVSIFFDTAYGFRLRRPGAIWRLHKSCGVLIERLRGILNSVSRNDYPICRKVSTCKLMASLADRMFNMLLVGDTCCFLIVAACSHPNLFVGTKRVISLKAAPKRQRSLQDIKDLVLRYAGPISTV